MLDKLLKEKDYLPILKMNDGTPVTKENWEKRREEMLELIEKYSYGRTPPPPKRTWGETTFCDELSYGGKAINEKVTVSFETDEGVCSFPIEIFNPKRVQNPPVFLHIAFRDVPDRYIPVEEIIDGGYALVVVRYTDLVNDNHYGDYSDGIAKHFGTTQDRAPDEWGKIAMWAYGASRVMDYLTAERKDMDVDRVAVIGHSRLGKTALFTAVKDQRFYCAVSNNSGYGGAASSKHSKGEKITDFFRLGSWDWFCENFKQFVGDGEDCKPYDQSFLLALIAPRYLLVNSATEDRGADPEAEFLTTKHASVAWELLGEKGLVTDKMPVAGELLLDGNVGYFLREGRHYLSREDWNSAMRFLNAKLGR